MSISALFPGMEAYLDGDVEINNNVGADDTDDAVASADQSAEIASNVADANSEAKDSEIQAQMLVQMGKLYTHVKTYGIDRTFLSIYNSNGELNKVCGIRFRSCESMPVTGNPHSQYSARFIVAMEDENTGFWAGVKKFFATIWHWLKTTAQTIWQKIKSLFGVTVTKLEKTILEFDKECGMLDEIQVTGTLAGLITITNPSISESEQALQKNIEELANTFQAIKTTLIASVTMVKKGNNEGGINSLPTQIDLVDKQIQHLSTVEKDRTTASDKYRKLLDSINVKSNRTVTSGQGAVKVAKLYFKLLKNTADKLIETHDDLAKQGIDTTNRANDLIENLKGTNELTDENKQSYTEICNRLITIINSIRTQLTGLQLSSRNVTNLLAGIITSLSNAITQYRTQKTK